MSDMRVADYIAARLVEEGIQHVFLVSGGGMMFLSDAIAVNESLTAVCNHHEQASAMAAVGYAKTRDSLSTCFTSTGCGATNAITGLLNAWQDNVPVIFVSGQVKKAETTELSGLPLRQFGTQEADIVSVVKPISKYAIMVTDPESIAYHMDKALHLAKSGRKGPVWLDIPMDVQGAKIDPATMERYVPTAAEFAPAVDTLALDTFTGMLACAKRPVVILGQGVRLAGALSEFADWVHRSGIPVVAPFLGVGIMETDDPQYIGVIGIKGSRAANLAMQNADLIVAIGTRLSPTAIGYEYKLFAREAKKVVIDIDAEEHKKKTIDIDLFIHADAKDFLAKCSHVTSPEVGEWTRVCLEWKTRYPVCSPESRTLPDKVSMYHFVDALSRMMPDDAMVLSDAGSAFYVTTQAINLRGAQRYITSGGEAEMGFTLPAAIGACVARGGREVLGVTGDGSFQMNIQELQTIAHNRLPVKLFVWNNNGYLSIRATQNKFFDGRLVGTDSRSGLSLPDTEKIAWAYGLPYVRIENSSELEAKLAEVFAMNGPVVCEVMCPEDEPVIPTAASKRLDSGKMVSRPLEDMFPFLPRDEYLANLIVKPVEE